MADSPPFSINELEQLRDWLRKPGVLKEVVPWHISANQLIRLTRWINGEFVSIDNILGLEKILPEISQRLTKWLASKTITQPEPTKETILRQPPAMAGLPEADLLKKVDPRQKRSTEKGEGREKLIAALTKHHQYADGSCLNQEPVGNNELARRAHVAKRTASSFFKKEFVSHSKYRSCCLDIAKLTAALKLLNGEYSPSLLYGSTPERLERDEE